MPSPCLCSQETCPVLNEDINHIARRNDKRDCTDPSRCDRAAGSYVPDALAGKLLPLHMIEVPLKGISSFVQHGFLTVIR